MRLQGDDLVVRDLLSTNGTFVQDKKISEAALKPGQTLRLGNVELRLESSAVPTSHANLAKTKIPSGTGALEISPVAAQKPAMPIKAEIAGDSSKKHHVLFVDDSLAFLETFARLCSELSNGAWEIHSATTADRALAICGKVRLTWSCWISAFRWWMASSCSASSLNAIPVSKSPS